MIIDELSEESVSFEGDVKGPLNPVAPITPPSNKDYDFLSESDDLHEKKEDKEVITDSELDMVTNMLTKMYDELDLENNAKKSDAVFKHIEGFFENLDVVNEADYEKHKKSMGLEEVDTKKLDAKIQKEPNKFKKATEKAMKGDSTDLAMLMAMPLEEAEKDEDGEDQEEEYVGDDERYEFEKGKEAGEKEGKSGIEDIAADLDGTESDLMGNLMNALKIAKGMDNEKLEVQIGNTLKFFVSTYIDKEENER